MCEEYRINVPYAKAKYGEYKGSGVKVPNNLIEVSDELDFIYGNNGFSRTLAADAIKKHNGDYLRILEEIIKEE